MKRETAKLVHNYFDQAALEIYVKDRVDSLHDILEDCRDMHEVGQTQGAIIELKRLLKAKEYAENILKVK